MLHWQQYQQTIVDSILIDSGRSCLNASCVWLPTRGREIAEALAKSLAAIPARAMDDPKAQLAAILPSTTLGRHIQRQLIRCATSVAANYRAACHAQTRPVFVAKN